MYSGLFFYYSLNSDIGHIHSQFGYITHSGEIDIFNNFPFYDNEFEYFPKRFYKIPWNESELLIEDTNIPFFCSWVNAGFYNKSNDFFPFLIKSENKSFIFTGQPIMPSTYSDWIFSSPIYAEVLEKHPADFSIKINKGSKHNLFIGCDFFHNVDFGSIYTLVQLSDTNAILQDQITLEMSKNSNIDEPIKAIGNGSKYLPSIRDRYKSLIIGDTVSTLWGQM